MKWIHHRKPDLEHYNGYLVVWQNDWYRFAIFLNFTKYRTWIIQLFKTGYFKYRWLPIKIAHIDWHYGPSL